jgi:hypothetical protein
LWGFVGSESIAVLLSTVGRKGEGKVVPCMRGFLVLGLYLFCFGSFPALSVVLV